MGPTGTLAYACSICVEPSRDICVYCTKDACRLHRCQRCLRCSDCCECESPLCLDEEPAALPIQAIADPVEAVAEFAPAEEVAVPEPASEPDVLEATEPGPAYPDEHFPGTSTNGSW
jgi:hypothetical protein